MIKNGATTVYNYPQNWLNRSEDVIIYFLWRCSGISFLKDENDKGQINNDAAAIFGCKHGSRHRVYTAECNVKIYLYLLLKYHWFQFLTLFPQIDNFVWKSKDGLAKLKIHIHGNGTRSSLHIRQKTGTVAEEKKAKTNDASKLSLFFFTGVGVGVWMEVLFLKLLASDFLRYTACGLVWVDSNLECCTGQFI